MDGKASENEIYSFLNMRKLFGPLGIEGEFSPRKNIEHDNAKYPLRPLWGLYNVPYSLTFTPDLDFQLCMRLTPARSGPPRALAPRSFRFIRPKRNMVA